MDRPNFVLKTDELVRVPQRESKAFFWLKVVACAVVFLLIVFSLVFGENMLSEMTWGTKALFFVLLVAVFLSDKKKKVHSQIEIRFYDDYLDVYREKLFYNRMISKKEHNKIYYKDVKKSVYRTSTNRMNFYGMIEGIWYNYKSNGELPDKPSYHKTVDTICYFYVEESQKDFIVSEIEAHSPLKVTFEDL